LYIFSAKFGVKRAKTVIISGPKKNLKPKRGKENEIKIREKKGGGLQRLASTRGLHQRGRKSCAKSVRTGLWGSERK